MNQTNSINRESITQMVSIFYNKSIEDKLLSEIFIKSVKDKDQHIKQVTDFWCSIMLNTADYKGSFKHQHEGLKVDSSKPTNDGSVNLNNQANVSKKISQEHFTRWLDLFAESANNIFVKEIANQFIKKSEVIASKMLKPMTGE